MNAWPKVKLGEVLRHRKEFVTIDDLLEYRRPRVQLHAQGIVVRDTIVGALIKTKNQQVCRAGEFLVAEIDAKVGGYGIVPTELDGSIVSSHYFLFVIDETKLNHAFLDYFIRTPSFRGQVAAQGSTNYAAIRPGQVLSYEIPLPPLTEQRRVVARIEEIATQINEARSLRQQAVEEAEALWECGAAKIFADAAKSNLVVPLSSLISVRGGGTPSKSDPLYWDGKIPWVTPKDMKRREISDAIDHISERATRESSAKLLEPGSVLVVVRGMILAHTFPSAVLRAPAAINQDMKALIPNDRIQPEFLCTQLWARNDELVGLVAKSTHDTRKFESSSLLGIQIVLPTLTEQRRIVAELDTLQASVDTLKCLQSETAAELDALLPAILDRAFKGDLLPCEQTGIALDPRFSTEAPAMQHSRRFIRAVFAAEIVSRLYSERTFGQVKFQKALFLGEYVAQVLEIESHPQRFQNGPHDPELIREVEEEMRFREWFESFQRTDGSPGHAYRALAHTEKHRNYFEQFWPENASAIRRVIDTLLKWDTERCERLATAYAAWNDIIIWGRPVSDAAVLKEILERWHPAKVRIPKSKWQETLDWMCEHTFVPTGFGHATTLAPQAELF